MNVTTFENEFFPFVVMTSLIQGKISWYDSRSDDNYLTR